MENIIRSQGTRRFTDRREATVTLVRTDRRNAERRIGSDRREVLTQAASWWHSRMPTFMQPLLSLVAGPRNSEQIHVPLWVLLSVFVGAFLYLIINFGASPVDVFMTQSAQELDEVIIFDPSEKASSDIVRSGYTVIENVIIKDLNVKIQRLRIPNGMSVPEALKDLHKRFPELEIDANSLLYIVDTS